VLLLKSEGVNRRDLAVRWNSVQASTSCNLVVLASLSMFETNKCASQFLRHASAEVESGGDPASDGGKKLMLMTVQLNVCRVSLPQYRILMRVRL
jgi:hypothetical protein